MASSKANHLASLPSLQVVYNKQSSTNERKYQHLRYQLCKFHCVSSRMKYKRAREVNKNVVMYSVIILD